MRNAYTIHRPVANEYLVRERDRRRFLTLGAVVLMLAPIAAALGVFLWLNVQVLETGYTIGAQEQTLHELSRRESELRLEASHLASPARIEEQAITTLEMAQPQPGQVFFLAGGS